MLFKPNSNLGEDDYLIQCKLRLLRRAQSRWGFQRGEAAALLFGRTRGFKSRVRYNLILPASQFSLRIFREDPLFAGDLKIDRANLICKTCHESPISGDGLFDVNQFEGVPDVCLATGNHRFSNFPLQELDIPDG